jgi:hypothetical protein
MPLRPATLRLACCLLLTLLPAGSPPAAGATIPEWQWLPDLQIHPSGLRDRRIVDENGRKVLRFSTLIVNAGNLPIEVRGQRVKGRMVAYQMLVRFGKVIARPFGEFHYHDEHHHWHLLQVAEHRLRNAVGEVVRGGDKVSFCLRDSVRLLPQLKGSPAATRYGDCESDPNAQRLKAGVSIGWADFYHRSLEGQSLDVTELPPGQYRLEVEVNPDRLLVEWRVGNNVTSVPVTIQ